MTPGSAIAFFVIEVVLVVAFLLSLFFCPVRESGPNADRRAPARAARRAAAPPPPPRLKLPYFPYSTQGRRASERLVCAICLEQFWQGELCSEVPVCRHMFHRDCLDGWMKTGNSCPLCRLSIAPGSKGVSAADDIV